MEGSEMHGVNQMVWSGLNERGFAFRRWGVGALVGALALAAPALAQAATCVKVDEQRDGLTAEERSSAQTLFEDTLRHNQIETSRDNCGETWTLYHVRLGSSITIVVQSPRGERRERVDHIEDLPGMYDQMTKSILTGLVGTSESPVVDRRNVTESQTRNQRISAEAFWYARLGYGATPADGFDGGPAFGFGIDFSFLNLTMYQDSDGYDGIGGSWLKLGVDYFFDPYANHTPYVGAGLSWGGTTVPTDDELFNDYSGSGLQGELMLGYEMFRASTLRLFVEANATLPMYRTSRQTLDAAGGSNDREYKYAPMFTLSLGIGWGSAPRTVNVNVNR
jgi:hypothetical protein